MVWAGFAILVCFIVVQLQSKMANAPSDLQRVFRWGRAFCLCGAFFIFAGIAIDAAGF